MIENRVRQVRLKVHASKARREPSKALAERFTRTVLDRVCAHLETRFPGRTVLVKRLAARWVLTEEELADAETASRFAAELAESACRSTVAGANADNQTGAAVVFEDEAAWLAAYLTACSKSTDGAWYHARWRGEGLRVLLGLPAGVVMAVTALVRLAAAGELIAVLERLPTSIVKDLAQALEVDSSSAILAETGLGENATEKPNFNKQTETQFDAQPASELMASLARLAKSLPTHFSMEGTAVALFIHALSQALSGSANDLSISIVGEAMSRQQGVLRKVISAVLDSVKKPFDIRETAPTQSVTEQYSATDYGGLFYLLSTVLELGIAETLWKACLPEGRILAAATAALLGPPAIGDPAPALFGGISLRELTEEVPVLPAQQIEVSKELLSALAQTLLKSGRTAVLLDLVEASAGRVLVAVTSNGFVLFAWPAPDSAGAAAGLAAFLKAWPRSGPTPVGSKALAALDTTGVLKAADARPEIPALLLPPGSVSATCLLAQIGGSLAFWFAEQATSHTAGPGCRAEEFAARFLTIPARVRLEAEEIRVIMPMERIDLELRRAALDRDPGWIPWLQRTVRLEFQSREEAEISQQPVQEHPNS